MHSQQNKRPEGRKELRSHARYPGGVDTDCGSYHDESRARRPILTNNINIIPRSDMKPADIFMLRVATLIQRIKMIGSFTFKGNETDYRLPVYSMFSPAITGLNNSLQGKEMALNDYRLTPLTSILLR